MKFYSEMLNKLFDSEKDLIKAETQTREAEAKALAAEKAKKAARTTRAKEVEAALKAANEAQSKAMKLLRDFTRDYGYFHMSYSTNDAEKVEDKQKDTFDFFDILNSFLE